MGLLTSVGGGLLRYTRLAPSQEVPETATTDAPAAHASTPVPTSNARIRSALATPLQMVSARSDALSQHGGMRDPMFWGSPAAIDATGDHVTWIDHPAGRLRAEGMLRSLLRQMERATPQPLSTPLPRAAGNPQPAPAPSPATEQARPPTRITIPSIGLDTAVIPVGWRQEQRGDSVVSVWNVADDEAGWHVNSMLPGHTGNMVIAGHSDVKGEVFRDLEHAQVGDVVHVYVEDRPYTYVIEERFAVQETGATAEQKRENARWIGSFPDERLTLITCWPYTSATHRLIVIARPLANAQDRERLASVQEG